MTEKRLLKAKDVAEMLGVTVGAFKQWVLKGYFPPGLKVGRARFFTREMVEAWLRDRQEAGNKDAAG